MANKVPNLHSTTNSSGVTYYRYKLPNGSYQALGKDRAKAETLAKHANTRRNRHDNTIGGAGARTMLSLIDAYEPVKLRSTKSAKSKSEWSRKFRRYREWTGGWTVNKVSVVALDKLLEEKAPTYEPYRLHRLLFGELFAYAIGKGWRSEYSGNPGKALLTPKLARPKIPKQRSRLTLEQFNSIKAAAPEWLAVAMDFALQTGIRRTDLSQLKLTDFKEGYVYFIPSKTSDLPDPAALKFTLGTKLKSLLQTSLSMSPASPYFISKYNRSTGDNAEGRKHVTQVLPEQISRHFYKARAKADQDLFKHLKKDQLPTFHEIRSLSARLYRDQGLEAEQIQTLLGHGEPEMTELYLATGEVQWTEINAEIG